MPSVSKKQHNFMEMVANNPKMAKKVGVPQSVGKDFAKADKGKKFGTGGDVKYTFGGKNQVNKQRTRGGSTFGYQKEVPDVNNNKYAGLKIGGSVRTDLQKANVKKTDHGNAALFKKGGIMKSDMKEDMAADKKQDVAMIKKAFKEHDAQEHKGGKGTKLTLKKGGAIKEARLEPARMEAVKTSPSRDGVAQRGRTKGRVC